MIKTGFKFIDDSKCLDSGNLVSIQGKCFQVEQFVISLMQGILDYNNGYVLLMQKRDFDYFTASIFNEYSDTSDNTIVKERISKKCLLPRGLLISDAELLQRSLSAWLEMDKFKHLQNKKLLAVVVSLYKLRCDITEETATLILKDVAQMLKVPVICWQKDSLDILLATDMTFKITAERGYKEPIDIEVIKASDNKPYHIQANKSSLKYKEHLKDCPKLWFYEEK